MKQGGSRKSNPSGNQAALAEKTSNNSSLNSGGFISESDGASESDVPLSAEEVK
jgi:hypothetical protein